MSEKDSEKFALYVALIASILALVFSIHTFLVPSTGIIFPPKPGPASGAPGRRPGGGMMMRPSQPSPETVKLYDERIKLLEEALNLVSIRYKTANAELDEVYRQQYLLDEARLKQMRLKNGRRATPSFAEAWLTKKVAETILRDQTAKYKAGAASIEDLYRTELELNQAKLRLIELERRLDKAKVAEAKKAVQRYPSKLTNAQLEKLLAAEQRGH